MRAMWHDHVDDPVMWSSTRLTASRVYVTDDLPTPDQNGTDPALRCLTLSLEYTIPHDRVIHQANMAPHTPTRGKACAREDLSLFMCALHNPS